jgi:hypothetical protein
LDLNREFFSAEDETLWKEIERFEAHYTKSLGYPVTVRDFSLDDVIKKVETVGFSDDLITQKVHDTVIRGAEDQEDLLGKFAKVVDMQSEIEVVPLITPDDFKIYPGVTGNTRFGGGVFDRVKLDCSGGRGIYKMDLGFEHWWKKSNGYGAIEEALWAAGNAIFKDIITKVMADLEADVNAAMTNAVANWGNSHYKALVKADSLIRAEGMTGPFSVLISPAEVYDLMILDYFIQQDYARTASALPKESALIGVLFGSTPIFAHRGVTAAKMTMVSNQKSSVVGFYEPLTIVDYEDVRQGMEGSVLRVQYDYKNGSDAEMTKPTQKSWAIATGA